MLTDAAAVLDDGSAVHDDVDPDLDTGADDHAPEQDRAVTDASRGRHDRSGVDEDRRQHPEMAQVLEEGGAPG